MSVLKVSCWSDLHLDYGFDILKYLELPQADVLLIPGDLACDKLLFKKGLKFLSERFKHVICVPGNHEFENKDMLEHRTWLANLEIPNVSILDDGVKVIENVRFIGSTLWSDCLDDQTQANIAQYIFAYWPIQYGKRTFTPADSTELHYRMCDYIAHQLSEARRMGQVSAVVTHHAPSKQSIHTRFLRSANNPAFYTDLEDFIGLHQPDYWFHGHMHHSSRYEIGQGLVLSNPLGHPLYVNEKFDSQLVIPMTKRYED
ncbi:metallophosphoesterase [Pseudomonas luteola]